MARHACFPRRHDMCSWRGILIFAYDLSGARFNPRSDRDSRLLRVSPTVPRSKRNRSTYARTIVANDLFFRPEIAGFYFVSSCTSSAHPHLVKLAKSRPGDRRRGKLCDLRTAMTLAKFSRLASLSSTEKSHIFRDKPSRFIFFFFILSQIFSLETACHVAPWKLTGLTSAHTPM